MHRLQFMPIPLKLHRRLGHGLKVCLLYGHNPKSIFYMCLGHGLKMCILFGHNPKFIFVTFLQKNLVIFAAKVNRY